MVEGAVYAGSSINSAPLADSDATPSPSCPSIQDKVVGKTDNALGEAQPAEHKGIVQKVK